MRHSKLGIRIADALNQQTNIHHKKEKLDTKFERRFGCGRFAYDDNTMLLCSDDGWVAQHILFS